MWPAKLPYVYDSNGNVIGLITNNGTLGLAQTYTWATKPLASAYMGAAFISDIGGGSYWVSNGVRWKPLNNNLTYYDLPAYVESAAITLGTPIVIHSVLIPAGVWQNGDILNIPFFAVKMNGAVDTISAYLYFSTTSGAIGTRSDNTYLPPLAAGSTRTFGAHRIRRLSSASFEILNNYNSGVGGASTTTVYTTTGLPSLDDDFYLQVGAFRSAGASGGETLRLVSFQVNIESNPSI